MTAVLDQKDAGGWLQWVTDLDGTYRSFTENYNALVSLRPWTAANAPQELANVDKLISDAQDHIATLTKLRQQRDYIVGWLNWLTTGISNGVNYLENTISSAYGGALSWLGLNGMGRAVTLGIAPIVVGAISLTAAAAALVVIGYWIQRAYAEAQRLNALQALIGQGQSPQQAAAIVDQTLGPAGGGSDDNLLGIPWTLLITGAVIVAVGPHVVDLIRGRKAHAA